MMNDINADDFNSVDFEHFRHVYLVEKNLDKSHKPNFGEISSELSKLNIKSADKLNKWTSRVTHKVNKYLKKIDKNGRNYSVKLHSISDVISGGAPTIKISTPLGNIEVQIFDDSKIVILTSKKIANSINLKENEQLINSIEKVAGQILEILEKVHAYLVL